MTGTPTAAPSRVETAVAVKDAEQRLSALRRRARTGILVEAAGLLLLLLAGYAAVTFVVDRNLRLELPFRAALLAAFALLVARHVRQRLVQPLAVRLDDDEMALAVERRAPGLRQALISALQFGRALGGAAPIVDSRALMQAVVTDVGARMPTLPFAAAIDARRVRRFAALGGAVVLAFAGWGLLDAEGLGIWARRNLLLSGVEWPRYTKLYFLGAEGTTVRLPQGDPYTVRIGVGGPMPDQVRLHYEFQGGEDGVEPMSRTGDGEFTLTLDALLANCELWAEGGDGLSSRLHIEIVERPRIENVQVQVSFPDYMHKEPETLPPTEAEVRLVRGSALAFAGHSHKPIREAFALVGEQKLPLERDPDRHSFHGGFVPKAGGVLELDVIDDDLLGAGAPPRFLVRMVDDKPPTIDLKLRGISSLITAQARIPGTLKVKDDFGITKVAAGVRVTDDRAAQAAGPAQPAAADQPPADLPFEEVEAIYGDSLAKGATRYETTASVDIQQCNRQPEQEDAPENKVRPGMLLSLRYTAKDNYGPGEPHETKGEVLTFRVVTREKLLEELRRRQVEQRQEAERILDEERTAALELKETMNPAAADPRAGQAKSRFRTLARQQQALGRQVAFVGELYQRILWEYENNRVMDSNKVREMEGLITLPLEALAKEPFPATARQVEAFAGTGDEATRQAALSGYADIQVRLQAIINVMEQAETLAAVLEMLKGVIKTQDKAIQDVERRLREAGENVFGPGREKQPGTGNDPNKK